MGRPANILLRTFFEKRNKKQVICTNEKCENRILTIHGANLERHLKTVHPKVFKEYLKKKESQILKKKRQTVERETIKIDTIENETIECETIETGSVESDTDESDSVDGDIVKLCCIVNKKHIQMAFIELFTKSDTPIHLAEDHAFKIIVNPILNELKVKLTEQNVMEQIAEFSFNLKSEISEELRGKLISLKIDAATMLAETILAINVQFIKNNNVIIKTLAIKQFNQSITSGLLKTLIMVLLAEYDIKLEQVVTITTDNGANTIAAVTDSNNDLHNSLDEFCGEADLIRFDSDLSIDGISHIECGAHILQMCVFDVLKSIDIQDKLGTVRTAVKKLRTKLYLNKLKSRNFKIPLLDNITNWSSTYHMLERFIELKEFIESIEVENVSLSVCSEIWSFAFEFLDVFQAIYTTSKKLQTENFIYSDLYIEITKIIIEVENLPKSDLKLNLIESINKQKSKLLENDLFVSAIFLDPRIKVCLTFDQCEKAKSCVKQLYTRLSFLREQEAETKMHSAASTASSSNNVDDALEEYFKAFDQTSNKKIFATSHPIEQDLYVYERQNRLSIKENILDFWSKQQIALTEIALLVLGIPCGQASNERLFSDLANIQSDQRKKLDFKNLEHILLVKSNAEFIYD